MKRTLPSSPDASRSQPVPKPAFPPRQLTGSEPSTAASASAGTSLKSFNSCPICTPFRFSRVSSSGLRGSQANGVHSTCPPNPPLVHRSTLNLPGAS